MSDSNSYSKGLQLAQQVQAAQEALGVVDAHAAAVDSAARALGIMNVLFNGQPDGFRVQGGDAEAEASTIGSHPQSKGAGLVFPVPGTGSVASRSALIRGPRLSSGPLDTPAFFRADRQYLDYKTWDSTAGFAHPDLQLNVPVQANVSYLLIAYTYAQLFAATTATQLYTRIRIGAGAAESKPTWEQGGEALSNRSYIQSGVQQWFPVTNFHARYICIETTTPAEAGEPVPVETRLYREGTLGNNRLGNAFLVVLRLPV